TGQIASQDSIITVPQLLAESRLQRQEHNETNRTTTAIEKNGSPQAPMLPRSSVAATVSGGPVWLLVTALVGLVLLGLYPCMSVASLALVRSVEDRVEAPLDPSERDPSSVPGKRTGKRKPNN
ncbi:MAG: hypothetical protein AAFX99_17195, partial [Myxococcota bacterium]